jgi:hypothetical protein
MLDLWTSGAIADTLIILQDTIDGNRAIAACDAENVLSDRVEFDVEDGMR